MGIAIFIIVAIAVAGFMVLQKDQEDMTLITDTTQDTSQIGTDTAPNAAGTSLAGSGDANKSDTPVSDAGEQDTNYTIDMFNFGFSIEQIKAAPGDTITVELTNSGGTHDFVIDELNVQSDTINTGGNAVVTFTIPPDAAGKTFDYYCSIMNHRAQGMVGQLVISE